MTATYCAGCGGWLSGAVWASPPPAGCQCPPGWPRQAWTLDWPDRAPEPAARPDPAPHDRELERAFP
jgi:hypothetical protein